MTVADAEVSNGIGIRIRDTQGGRSGQLIVEADCDLRTSGAANSVRYELHDGPTESIPSLVLPLCADDFVGFDPDYLRSRLPLVSGLRLWLAYCDDEVIGFKLGYEREPRLFYSWLGAVKADFRRGGVAAQLVQRQHADLVAADMRFVETRTRAENAAMIIVNLKHGFLIAGFEVDTAGRSIVWQRKTLYDPSRLPLDGM